jgi:flagellar basal body-associated protein FliL
LDVSSRFEPNSSSANISTINGRSFSNASRIVKLKFFLFLDSKALSEVLNMNIDLLNDILLAIFGYSYVSM